MESLGLSGGWRLAIWGGRSYYKYIARLPGVGVGRGMEEDSLFSQSFFRGGEGESHNIYNWPVWFSGSYSTQDLIVMIIMSFSVPSNVYLAIWLSLIIFAVICF